MPARRRQPTAVILRCAEQGHELLTIQPAFGRFVVVRAAGRAGGNARDTDHWLTTGVGTEPNFETLPVTSREIAAADAGTVAGLLGHSPFVFCRCGSRQLTEDVADQLGDALYEWCQSSIGGATRPKTVITAVT